MHRKTKTKKENKKAVKEKGNKGKNQGGKHEHPPRLRISPLPPALVLTLSLTPNTPTQLIHAYLQRLPVNRPSKLSHTPSTPDRYCHGTPGETAGPGRWWSCVRVPLGRRAVCYAAGVFGDHHAVIVYILCDHRALISYYLFMCVRTKEKKEEELFVMQQVVFGDHRVFFVCVCVCTQAEGRAVWWFGA